MQLDPGIFANRELIKRIASEHGALNVRVFGPRARGDAVLDLERALGFRVDVVTERALRPGLRETVLKEAVSL